MVTVRETVDIEAPVERVFSFMDTPAHQTEITPSLTQSTLLERRSNGGSRARYTYRIFGLPFSGEVRATNYVPEERIVWVMEGSLRGTIRWYFEAIESGCRLTYAATYEVPGPGFLTPLLRPVVRRYNEQEVHTLLDNLKGRLESRERELYSSDV